MLLGLMVTSTQAAPALRSWTRSNTEKYARIILASGVVLDMYVIDNRSGTVLPSGGAGVCDLMT
jgi:hypothetical protein